MMAARSLPTFAGIWADEFRGEFHIAVTCDIDGAIGSRRFLQFFGDPGPRRIAVIAQTEEGDLETLTQEIRVDSCTVDTPPLVHGRANPYHPGFVDFTVSGGFGLGNALSRAVAEGAVDYSLDGTVTVDAGLLGQPSFGPSNLLRGTIDTR